MSILIENRDFQNSPAMKYWSVPKGKSTKDEMISLIYSGNYCLSQKRDGNWLMIGKSIEGVVFTRARNANVNGEFPSKIGHIPHIAKTIENLPNGTVFLGEIYLKSNEQSRAVTTILGCLEEKAILRQEKGEKLSYYIFDCLAFDGKDISQLPIIERVEIGKKIYDNFLKNSEYIEFAKYIYEPEKMEEYIATILSQGKEGVVLQRKDNPYEWGKRTAHKTLKVKKEVANNIDCFTTGRYKPATVEYTGKEIQDWVYWQDLRTGEKFNKNMYNDYLETNTVAPITKGHYYGWAGAIELAVWRDNQEVAVAWISNVTEEIKAGIVSAPDQWTHRVCEVQAMMIEEDTKALRHGKIMKWRDDKDWRDCDGHEIFG